MAVLDLTFAPKLMERLAEMEYDSEDAHNIIEAVVETLAEDPSMIAMVEDRRMRNTKGD